jgi:DNA-binding beta-propeller fold protein YncE
MRSSLFALACLFSATAAVAVEVTPARLAVSFGTQHRVVFYSPLGAILGQVPTGVGPHAMTLYQGKLYVADRGVERAFGSDVMQIDPQTMQAERTIQVCEGCGPSDVEFDPQGTMWVVAQGHQALYALEPPFDAPAGSILVSWGWPREAVVLPGTSTLVISMRNTNDLALVDGAARKATKLTVGPFPDNVALRPHSNEVWATASPMGMASVWRRAEDGSLTGPDNFKISEYPKDFGFTPDGKQLLVAASGKIEFAIFDVEQRRLLASIDVPGLPTELAVSPDGTAVAVASRTEDGLDQISMIELGDGTKPRLLRSFSIPAPATRMLWF